MENGNKMNEDEMARKLREKEEQSGLEYDANKSNEESQANNVQNPKEEQITSLGKASAYQDRPSFENVPGADLGWKSVPVDNLPSAGIFYPEGTQLEIKAAHVSEIRHFSTIDEQDPLDMDDKLNMIVDKCMRLKFPDRQASYRDLKEEDRFQLIFAIRELTFKNGENKLFVNMRCGANCLGDGSFQEKVELKKENFDYYKIDPKLMQYYDPSARGFIIEHPKVGTIRMYVPSLGVTTFIKNYLREKIQRREFYDKAFIKVAPFLFDDWRTLNEAKFAKMQQESMGWGPYKLSAILKIAEMIRFGVKTELKRNCDKCGAEVAAPLTFPGGIKSLFLVSDPLSEIFGE